MFILRSLGALTLEGPSGPLRGGVAQRRRLALLATLGAAGERGVSRDKLAGYLWPESDETGARHLLSDSVYVLRKALGEEAILDAGEFLRLNQEVVWCDAVTFEAAIRGEELEEAVGIYVGPFVDGFYLDTAGEWDQWVETERRRLADVYAKALEVLAERAESASDHTGAAEWWKRLAAHDPYNSRVVLRLMQALAAAGDPANALEYARVHELRVREELGIEPPEDLRAYVERLRAEPVRVPNVASEVTHSGVARGATPEPVPVTLPTDRNAEPRPVSLLRVLTTYALVSLAVLLAVHIFTLQLGLPDWFFPGAVVVLLVCLPIIVATALVQRAAISARRSGAEVVVSAGAARRWLTWRNAIGAGVGLFALLGVAVTGYMALRVMGIGPWSTLIAKGVLEERDRIVLAEFDDHTGDSLALTVTEAMRVRLEQSPVVRVADGNYVGRVLERMERDPDAPLTYGLAREVAIREGLKAVVSGAINSAGSGYVLSSRLVAAETGETLDSFLETAADPDAILPAIDRLSAGVRERIGESLKSIRRSPPLRRVQTASLEALRLRSQGTRAHARGDQEQTIELATKAIEIDSLFASAYDLRSKARRVWGIERGQMIADAIRAYELSRRLPLSSERYHIEAVYHWSITHDEQKVIAAFNAAIDLEPDDYWSLDLLGYAYRRVRDLASAESAFRCAIEVDSVRSPYPWNGLIPTQFDQGKFVEAEETLRKFEELFPEYPTTHRADMAVARGDYEAAEAHVWEFLAASSTPSMSTTRSGLRRGRVDRNLAALALVKGEVAEGERYLRNAMSDYEQAGLIRPYLIRAVSLGRTYYFVRRLPDQALQVVETALQRHPLGEIDDLDRPYIALANFYAQIGRPDRAKELLSELESVVEPTLLQAIYNYEAPGQVVVGNIALAEGRLPDAIREFQTYRQRSEFVVDGALADLARAYEAAAAPDSAIAVYERYVTTPRLSRISNDFVWLPYSYERLGDLFEQRGDTAKAVLYYGKLVDLWKDADPELQPRVEAARRAIKALSPDR